MAEGVKSIEPRHHSDHFTFHDLQTMLFRAFKQIERAQVWQIINI